MRTRNDNVFRTFVAAILLGSATLATQASAEVRYVRFDLDSGENDGTSWANAFSGPLGLQAALAAAQNGDQIWVAQGTYHPAAVGQRSVSFVLRNGVHLYGGFAGDETSLDERDPDGHVTILSGDLAENGSGTGFQADNSFHVVKVDLAYDPTTLDGFTITGGATDCCTPAQAYGAGIQMSRTTMTIRNCRFEQNDADLYGGDISITDASPLIESCHFNGTSAASRGLNIYHIGLSAATIRGCEFVGTPRTTGGTIGAGILTGSTSTIGITIEDCHFSIQTTDFACVSGVGVMVSTGARAAITRCDFIGNTTCGGGGGIYTQGITTIDRCRFIGNEGLFDGGAALFVKQGSTVVSNSIFVGNSKQGFNTVMAQAPATFLNCTFANNGRTDSFHFTVQATVTGTTLTNCILWANRSSLDALSSNVFLSSNGIRPRFDSCVVQGWNGTVPGTDTFSADPKFVSLLGADGLAGTIDDDFRLRAGSPCEDRGLSTQAVTALHHDLDGRERTHDEPRVTLPGFGPIDLGAYERARPSRNAAFKPTLRRD